MHLDFSNYPPNPEKARQFRPIFLFFFFLIARPLHTNLFSSKVNAFPIRLGWGKQKNAETVNHKD